MPEADTLLIIWVKLLAQAGKTNASGYIFLSENGLKVFNAILTTPNGREKIAANISSVYGTFSLRKMYPEALVLPA